MQLTVTTLTARSEIPRARHQVTDALIRSGYDVLFVEKNRRGSPHIEFHKERSGLTVATPFFPLDYRYRYRIPLINGLYQHWLFSKLKKETGDTPVINFDFTAHLLHRWFPDNVYYCNDEYIGNSNCPCLLVNLYHRFAEHSTARHARLCVSTAPSLTRKLSRINPQTVEIPLGGPPPRPEAKKRSFNNRRTIRIGLLGSVNIGHVSTDLIRRLLNEEDFTLILIGTVSEKFRAEVDLSRAVLKGVLTGDELYAELAALDVAIAPYNLERINSGVTPNKMYQYLACACPVVISALPNLEGMQFPPGTIYKAESDDDFIRNIRIANDEDCPAFAEARLQFAAENTWDRRIATLLANMHELNLIGTS